jgi:hypothetical protein
MFLINICLIRKDYTCYWQCQYCLNLNANDNTCLNININIVLSCNINIGLIAMVILVKFAIIIFVLICNVNDDG